MKIIEFRWQANIKYVTRSILRVNIHKDETNENVFFGMNTWPYNTQYGPRQFGLYCEIWDLGYFTTDFALVGLAPSVQKQFSQIFHITDLTLGQ